MKVFSFTRTALAPVVLFSDTLVVSFAPTPRYVPHQTTLFSKEVLSDMDIMCIANAADLCSYYDQCNIDEREALMNRFEEQTDLLADRIATMQSLSKHLRTGDHKHLQDEEVETLKRKLMGVVGELHPTNIEDLGIMEVAKLREEIAAATKAHETPGSHYYSLPLKWMR